MFRQTAFGVNPEGGLPAGDFLTGNDLGCRGIGYFIGKPGRSYPATAEGIKWLWGKGPQAFV